MHGIVCIVCMGSSGLILLATVLGNNDWGNNGGWGNNNRCNGDNNGGRNSGRDNNNGSGSASSGSSSAPGENEDLAISSMHPRLLCYMDVCAPALL